MSDSDATTPDPKASVSGSTEDTAPAPPPAKPTPSRGLDLSDLKIMPDWVANFGGASSGTHHYTEESERPSRGGDRPRRFDRGDRGDRNRGPRPAGGGDRPPRGDRPAFRRDDARGGGDRGPRRQEHGDKRHDRRDRRDEPRREWVELPQDVLTTVHPEDKSLDALAAHIRSSGHAFSLFDIARLVLAGGERFGVRFLCDEKRPQPLFRVPADGSLFLTRDEATRHVLAGPALETWYRTEEVELEEPKGNFPSVAVCGFSGELLGPASHHSFQTAVIRLHRERFANMPLEDYKRRIRTESDPEVIQKWKDQQRKSQRWIPVSAPEEEAEAAALSSRHEMEAHFRTHHAEQAVVETRDTTVHGDIDKKLLSPALFSLLRRAVDGARKHLFEMSQKLSAGFERRGLKCFKRRAGKMFVCRVRPRAIDPSTVFAGRVTAIVEQLKSAPGGLQIGQLVGALSTTPVPAPAEGAAASEPPPLTDEQMALLKDIRWLVNEGYIIEYTDGLVCLGVQGDHPTAATKSETAPPASPAPAEAPAPDPEPVATAPEPEVAAEEEAKEPAEEEATAPPADPESSPPEPGDPIDSSEAPTEILQEQTKEDLPDTPDPAQE